MIVMVEVTYPGTKAIEVPAMYLDRLKTDPTPEYVKIRDIYALAGGDGFRVLEFLEVEDGKEKEGFDHISRTVIHMLKNVDGYKANILTVYPMVEAFQILDMQPPSV